MTADKPDTSLEDIRREIDAIDDGLLQLLVRRFDASARVRATKKTDGSIASSPLRPAREAMMLRRLLAARGESVPADALVRLWRVILSASTQAQAPLAIHVDARISGDPGLSVRVAEHFSGMTWQLHPDTRSSLIELMKKSGDLAVVKLDSPWASWLSSQQAQAIGVVATLPVIAERKMPDLLVFGHADPQPSGQDETILISPDPLPASKMQLRWQGQSGDWHVSGYGGFLANSDIQGLGGNVFLAGRCPTSIEVF